MASPVLIKNRYELKDVLGRGGMGVVYKAVDVLLSREVAVKALREAASPGCVDLFFRECSVLTAMVHPNIVEIFDMGEFEEDGVMKPFFVMPLLPGRTVYDLLYPSAKPLPVERCADIISKVCRGLHAAHECGLLHRDIKPRNIFVLPDDAVKLTDFGVVRLLGDHTSGAASTVGTLHYMAPEQIAQQSLSARSDIFSLATVCYEALTGVHPFLGANETQTAAAVAEHTPALICTLNPLVNRPLSQAVAQAMAKDPRQRFESAAAFADALQRGLRNEQPGANLLNNPQNRLARAQRSFARGDYEFTQEIVQQLEAEGADGPELQDLRFQLADAVRKQQAEVHLTTARRYFAEQEYGLAMRRVTEVLEVDPSQSAALSLRDEIKDKLNGLRVADSLARAAARLDAGEFSEGRRLITDSLELQPKNAQAQRLLAEADRRAQDWPRQMQQQEELFRSAQAAYFAGHFDTSLRHLEQLAELARGIKPVSVRANEYQDFHKRVRSDYDALQAMLADAWKLLANGELEGALKLSGRLREQCPQDPDVLALEVDIEAQRDVREQEYRRGIATSLASQPDLSARLHILNQAVRSRPTDEYFHEERQKLQTQLQKVNELVQRAQVYEESGRYEYAIEEWLCVGDTYPAYPGLREQLARVNEAWSEAREKSKAELGRAVKQALKHGQQDHAAALLQAAEGDFEGDGGYAELESLIKSTANAHKEVAVLLDRIQKAESERRFGDIPTLAQAVAMVSENIDPLRQRTLIVLSGAASRLAVANWRVASQVAQEAARIGTVPDAVYHSISLQRREEEVTGILGEERTSQTNLEAYRERVAAMIAQYPGETRLEDRLRLLDVALVDKRQQDARRGCAAELALMSQELASANDHRRLWDSYIQAKNVAAPFAEDPEVIANLEIIREQGSQFEEAADALTRDRIKESFAICDAMLERHPGHVLFQKLRDQTTARYHQLGDDYLARVERWLASEPDVFQRELILQKAQEEYPFETRYAEELHHLQREKALAESIAGKARDLEKRGQTAEALGQWRQLRNLHASYPNLAEEIGRCEAIVDRAQRKARAQRLVAQGEEQLAEGSYAQGYELVREAAETSDEIADLLRHAAPQLVAEARAALAASPKLAEAMVQLAQSLDENLRVPKEMRAKIAEARKAEDLADCLDGIKTRYAAGDLASALDLADRFLETFPGAKLVEAARAKLLPEIEKQERERERAQVLDQFAELELSAAGMTPDELLNLQQSVQEIAQRHSEDEEVAKRASRLDLLLGSLAEVGGYLQARDADKAHEACTRALDLFPDHPLFQAARAEASRQKDAASALEVEQIAADAALEPDFQKQSAILHAALERFPGDPSLLDRLKSVEAKQAELSARIEKAREFETKRLFGEATKEWEAIGHDYPWFSDPAAEVDRLSGARRKDKQESLERWYKQVEAAIDGCDYDTASTMLRQASQQQPDRKLQSLDIRLKEAVRKKKEADAKFAAGSGLLAEGSLTEGGDALVSAFELQPRDQEVAQAISLLLLGQIRAHMHANPARCEPLIAHLNRVRPGQPLPPDIVEVMTRRPSTGMAQLADFAREAESARSSRALSAVSKKLQASQLLDSREIDVRRTAGELLKKVNSRLSAMEPQRKGNRREPQPEPTLSIGSLIAAVILLFCFGGVAFFLSRPPKKDGGVPVHLNVTPDHTAVELEGYSCVTPDCRLSLKPGEYLVKLRKTGYLPKDIVLPVKGTEKTPLNVSADLEPLVTARDSEAARTASAKVEIHGAQPGLRVRVDATDVGEASLEGTLTFDVPPGMHTLDLSLDGFTSRTIKRNFARGEAVSLANQDVQLQSSRPDARR